MAIASTRTTLGPQFSEGARLLWAAMESRGWSQGQVAKAIDAKGGVVPRWLYGDIRPGWDWAKILRDTFCIPLEAWTLEATEPFIPPAAREATSAPELPADGDDSDADASGAHEMHETKATGTHGPGS